MDPEESQVCNVTLDVEWGYGNMNNKCETTSEESSVSNSVALLSVDKWCSSSKCVGTSQETVASKLVLALGEESSSKNMEKTLPNNESVIASMESLANNMVAWEFW